MSMYERNYENDSGGEDLTKYKEKRNHLNNSFNLPSIYTSQNNHNSEMINKKIGQYTIATDSVPRGVDIDAREGNGFSSAKMTPKFESK